MTNISHNLEQIRQQITSYAASCQRQASEITLLAVSKTKPASAIKEAYDAGQRNFGENYAQELAEKALELKDHCITWHFIGPVQSNKTRQIAEHAHWVHSVDRFKVAKRLNEQRPLALPPLKVCIQVNIDNSQTKSGIAESELEVLIAEINALPHLSLQGLMAIPEPENATHAFKKLSALAKRHNLGTLSMGMSGDWQEAVAAGSTMIRIGTAIFGERDYTVSTKS